MEQKSAGIRIAPYLIGIICFILPFLEISCAGEKMMSFSGAQLATGYYDLDSFVGQDTENNQPNPFALIALIAVVLGLLFSLTPKKRASIMAGIMGIISVSAMLLMKNNIDAEMMKEAGGLAPVSVDYKVGFWGLCIASAIGALMAFMRVKDSPGQQHAEAQGSSSDESPSSQA